MLGAQSIKKTLITGTLSSAFFALSGLAMAQFVWIDANGKKVFSDRPPPSNIAKNKIIKGYKGGALHQPSEASASASAASEGEKAESEKSNKPKTMAEKNEDFNKRQLAKQEAEQKQAEEQKNKEIKTKNCDNAKNFQRTLDSGRIISRSNAQGEREILDEKARAQAAAENKKALSECH